MNTKNTFIMLLGLMAGSQAYAADRYIGFGLGQSEINQGFFGEYGNGFKIFAGMHLHNFIAIEAAYLDYGNPSENLFGINTEYEATAVAAWAKSLWPITQNIRLFAKAGVANWEVDKTTSVFGPPTTTSQDGNDFTWGVGISFNKWDHLAIQLEYEDINADIDAITLWSASVLYSF